MPCVSRNPGREDEMRDRLSALAREIACGLSGLEPDSSKELRGGFVSELFLSLAEQSRQEERRRKQARGIAAAKARGVRFGRPAPPLPEGFGELHRAWREGEMTLQQAADACGLAKSSFYTAAVRREQAENPAV